MLKDKIEWENKPYNNKALYVSVTQKCQLNCPFCFNKFVDGYNTDKELTADEIIKTIEEGNYSTIDFLGGEPLLKPQLMIDVMNHFKNKKEIIWCISSNLAFKKFTDLQLTALNMIQDLSVSKVSIGSSYNVDRFETQDYLDLWIKNMKYLARKGLNIGITVTITEKQAKEDPNKLIDIFYDTNAKSINLERCIFPKPESESEKKEMVKKYEIIDDYMYQCFKLLPIRYNYQFSRYYEGVLNRTPIFNNHCSEDISMLYPTGLVKGCALNSINGDVSLYASKLAENNCFICNYNDYCKGDCECTRWCCAFPKKTVSYVRELMWRDYK